MGGGLAVAKPSHEHGDSDSCQQGERKLDAIVGVKLHLGQDASARDAEKSSGANSNFPIQARI